MKVFEYDVMTCRRGKYISDIQCPSQFANPEGLRVPLTNYSRPDSEWRICTEIRDRAGRPVKFDTVVCFCQGKLTAGTETAWHWWIYVPSHFTHAFK